MWKSLGDIARCNDVSKLWLEGSTTDEETINIFLMNEFNAVSISDGTTIDDSSCIGDLLGDIGIQIISDEFVNFLSLSGGGNLAGTDSPNWLICKNN